MKRYCWILISNKINYITAFTFVQMFSLQLTTGVLHKQRLIENQGKNTRRNTIPFSKKENSSVAKANYPFWQFTWCLNVTHVLHMLRHRTALIPITSVNVEESA